MSPARRQPSKAPTDPPGYSATEIDPLDLPENVRAWHALLARRHGLGLGGGGTSPLTTPVDLYPSAPSPPPVLAVGETDPRLIEPDMSCRLLRAFLDVTAERFGHTFLRRTVEEAGLSVQWLEDANHWVSAEFLERMARAMAKHVINSVELPDYDHPLWQHWRECGWGNVRPNAMGALWPILFALGSPTQVYEASTKMTERGSRMMTAKVLASTASTCTIRFGIAPGHRDFSASCWNRIGFLEAVPTIWGLPLAQVEHPICIHKGANPGPHCEYHVRFATRSRRRWRRLLAMLGSGALVGLAAGWLADEPSALCAAMGLLSGATVDGWLRYVHQLSRTREDAGRLSEQLDIADHRYRDLVQERHHLRHALLLNRKIAGYVTRDVLEDLVANPEGEVELGGVRTDAAVLFVDLVGFTARCETESPERVVTLLNRFFAAVDPVVQRNGGTIDKRLGDGLMAVFASRAADVDANVLRRNAVMCGLQVLEVVAELNDIDTEAVPMKVHAGLAAGALVQGNMGSGAKLEYTVIGDVVNLASRLQNAAEPDELVMDLPCWRAAQELLPLAEPSELRVKGRSRAVQVVRMRVGADKSITSYSH